MVGAEEAGAENWRPLHRYIVHDIYLRWAEQNINARNMLGA